MRIWFAISAAVLGLLASPARAQPQIVADSGDSAWVLAAALLALTGGLGGFMLLRGADTAAKRAEAMLAAFASVVVLFAVIGYSLAFSEGNVVIGDTSNLLLANLADLRGDTTISETLYALFELSAAIFATALLATSIDGRARFGWLVAFVSLWFLLVYVPLAHWLWGGGWLADLGTVDTAGGLVIHVAAGVSLLVVAMLFGKSESDAVAALSTLPSSGLALVLLGAGGLVGGAALASDDNAAGAILNLVLAVCGAIASGLVIDRLRHGAASMNGIAMAALAGFAAISTSGGTTAPGGALLLGVFGALGAAISSILIGRLRLGTTGEAFAAHAGGGATGALLFPLFVLPMLGGPGFDEGEGLVTLLTSQGVGILVVAFWATGLSAVAALMAAMVLPMREGRG